MAQCLPMRDLYPAVLIMDIGPADQNEGFIRQLLSQCPNAVGWNVCKHLTFLRRSLRDGRQSRHMWPTDYLVCFTGDLSRNMFAQSVNSRNFYEVVKGNYRSNTYEFFPDSSNRKTSNQRPNYTPEKFSGFKSSGSPKKEIKASNKENNQNRSDKDDADSLVINGASALTMGENNCSDHNETREDNKEIPEAGAQAAPVRNPTMPTQDQPRSTEQGSTDEQGPTRTGGDESGPDRANENRSTDGLSLFVGKVPHNCSEDDLKDLFSTFGKVIKIDLRNKSSGHTRTGAPPKFGFITFDCRKAVETALRSKPIKLFGQRRLNVEEPKKGGDQTRTSSHSNTPIDNNDGENGASEAQKEENDEQSNTENNEELDNSSNLINGPDALSFRRKEVIRIADVLEIEDEYLSISIFGMEEGTRTKIVSVDKFNTYQVGSNQLVSDFITDKNNMILSVKMIEDEVLKIFPHEREVFEDEVEVKSKKAVQFAESAISSEGDNDLTDDEYADLDEEILMTTVSVADPILTVGDETQNEQLVKELLDYLTEELQFKKSQENQKRFTLKELNKRYQNTADRFLSEEERGSTTKTATAMVNYWQSLGETFLEDTLNCLEMSKADPMQNLNLNMNYSGKEFNKHLSVKLTAKFFKKKIQETKEEKRKRNILENLTNGESTSDDNEVTAMENALRDYVSNQFAKSSCDEILIMCQLNNVTLKFMKQGFKAICNKGDARAQFIRFCKTNLSQSRNSAINDFAEVLFDFFCHVKEKSETTLDRGYEKPPGIPATPSQVVVEDQGKDKKKLVEYPSSEEEGQYPTKNAELSKNTKLTQDSEVQTTLTLETIASFQNTVEDLTEKVTSIGKDQDDFENQLKTYVTIEKKLKEVGGGLLDLPNAVASVEDNLKKYQESCNEHKGSWKAWTKSIEKRIEALENRVREHSCYDQVLQGHLSREANSENSTEPKRPVVRLIEDGDEILVHTDPEGRLPEERVTSLFPCVTAIKFRPNENSPWRMILFEDGFFHPPDDGWRNRLYLCSKPKGIVASDASRNTSPKINAEAATFVPSTRAVLPHPEPQMSFLGQPLRGSQPGSHPHNGVPFPATGPINPFVLNNRVPQQGPPVQNNIQHLHVHINGQAPLSNSPMPNFLDPHQLQHYLTVLSQQGGNTLM